MDVFLASLPHVFQRQQSAGLNATYHFSFIGTENVEATVVIRNRKIEVQDGHVSRPDMRVTSDAQTWLGFLAKEKTRRAWRTRRPIPGSNRPTAGGECRYAGRGGRT